MNPGETILYNHNGSLEGEPTTVNGSAWLTSAKANPNDQTGRNTAMADGKVWIVADLGDPYDLTTIRIWNFQWNNTGQSFAVPPGTTARFIAIRVDSSYVGGGIGLGKVRFEGNASGVSLGGTTVTFGTPVVITPGTPDLVEVTATVTGTPASKVFARFKATQNQAVTKCCMLLWWPGRLARSLSMVAAACSTFGLSGLSAGQPHVSVSGTQELDWWKGKKIEDDKGYTTDLLTGYAVDFIARHKAKPFFMFVSHGAPHTPLQGRDPEKRQSPVETYQEMIEALDDSVGAIVKALDDQGLRENTLIIFCSDNGPVIPSGFQDASPFSGKKGSLLEGGHRVPAVFNWPAKLPSGKVCHDLLITMDLFPTFARLAGVSLPENHVIDGTDIAPILKGEQGDTQRVLHWRFGRQWAVRRGDWKLIDGRSLYHLGNDPEETKNLAGENRKTVRELLMLNRDWTRDVGNR